MDLSEYEQRKFALAEILRAAQEISTEQGPNRSDTAKLLAILAEDRFNLMVVGRFSRGKSSLMNALLGTDYLPTGIVPLTSVITTVHYGSRPRVVLNFMNSGLPRQISLSDLPRYVTQQSNPGNEKKIAVAEIQLPVELLRRGVYFVDSPGLGSIAIENTLTTERFLPQADAFILVTGYESPMSEEEDRILQRIQGAGKPLFVVLNKQDTVDEQQRIAALKYVGDHLRQSSSLETRQVFSISAKDALEAKVTGSEDQLNKSGLPDLEEALLTFLTVERAQAFLLSMFQRTITFLIEQAHGGDIGPWQQKFLVLAERLHEQRDSIVERSKTDERSRDTGAVSAERTYRPQVDPQVGCAVCAAIVRKSFDFLSKYQYQLVINDDEKVAHAQRGGFCPSHTWQYEAIASPQGVSESYPKVVKRWSEMIRDFLRHGLAPNGMNDLKRIAFQTSNCRMCQVQAEVERRSVLEVARAAQCAVIEEPNVKACCIRHLFLVIQELGPGEAAERLLQSHAELLERTAEDLQRYTLKHYAVRRYLASEEERHASKLALLLLEGHRNVVTFRSERSAL